MSKKSKAFKEALSQVDRDAFYHPLDAVRLASETSSKNYDATIDVAMRLGVDPRKADQLVRGTVSLPHGTGQTVRVAVFAEGEKATEATEAGAEIVGTEELIEQITAGTINFDVAIATPDQMAKVGRVARVLGPRGLMPNPKTGTVTTDTAKAVADVKGGKISFRVDKASNLHALIGKASFTPEQLAENYGVVYDEILRVKPSTSKGKYVKSITVASTMGVGIPVDPSVTRNYTEAAAE